MEQNSNAITRRTVQHLDGHSWPHWLAEENGKNRNKCNVILDKINAGASYDNVYEKTIEFQKIINKALDNTKNALTEPPINKLCKFIKKMLGERGTAGGKRKGENCYKMKHNP